MQTPSFVRTLEYFSFLAIRNEGRRNSFSSTDNEERSLVKGLSKKSATTKSTFMFEQQFDATSTYLGVCAGRDSEDGLFDISEHEVENLK